MDFKYNADENEYNNMIKKLDNIHEQSHKNTKLNIIDIFPNFEPESELMKHIVYTNLEIANNQFQNINEIIEFIKSQNYYGDVYQMKRDLQIIANKYWIDRFFPSTNEFKKRLENIRKDTENTINSSEKKIEEEMKKIISSF